MTNIKVLFSGLVVIVMTIFIFSCTENVIETDSAHITSVSSRSSGSDCSPQTLYTEYPSCTHTIVNRNISFATGLGLFSNSSVIKNLCPNLQVAVSFTHTTCQLVGGGEIHFVHGLTYNLANMIAACPALQNEINNQVALGTLVSFLDLIDHEISMQTEFTLAFEAALQDQIRYLCGNDRFYSVKYIKNTCYQWVPYVDGPKDRPINSYIKQDCMATVCCARSNNYCVQSFINGQPNLITGSLVNYQQFEGSCPLQCTHDCGAPNPNEI